MKLNDRVNKFENKFTEPKDAVEFQGTEIKSFREKVSSLKVSLGKEKSELYWEESTKWRHILARKIWSSKALKEMTTKIQREL